MQSTPAFDQSYRKFEHYPQNLIHRPLYGGATSAYKLQIRCKEPTLLQPETGKILIQLWELNSSSPALRKGLLKNDEELKEWLGGASVNGSNESSAAVTTRKDPQCRFIFIAAKDSRSPLQITRKSLLRLLSYHQVMPEYIDFLSSFGLQEGPSYPLFSSFCEQTMLINPVGGLDMPQMGRSGRHFQLCYDIKAPVLISAKSGWSIRQAAVHHQFDIDQGTSLWLITHNNLDTLDERIRNLTDNFGRPEDRNVQNPVARFRETLPVHLLHAFWALEQWKLYMNHLEGTIKESSRLSVPDEHLQAPQLHDCSPNELKSIQLLQEQITLAIAVLEASMRVLTALSDYYRQLLDNNHFTFRLRSCQDDILAFAQELDGFIRKMDIEHAKAQFLIVMISNRKDLVSNTSFSLHSRIYSWLDQQESEKTGSPSTRGSQNSERTYVDIWRPKAETVAQNTNHDPKVLGVISIVTLIYLPGTFVSTFFSTDIVKYQGTEDGSFSQTAMLRWVQVTVPLTIVTIGAAWAWFKVRDKEMKGRQRQLPVYAMKRD